MSYDIGWQAMTLGLTERCAHTEYCSNYALVRAVTGLDPQTDGSAWDKFAEAWDFDFIWSVDDGPTDWFKVGRATDMGHAEFLEGGIEVMVAGRHAASGDFREIRRLMTERPHQYTIRSSDDRTLAAAIIGDASTSGVQLAADGGGGSGSVGTDPATAVLHVQASDFAGFVLALPRLAREHGIRLYEVSPADESLESVFSYLVAR